LTVSKIVFDASHAVVFVNGVCATLADVYVGATAIVVGEVNDAADTGIASMVYADENVVGGIISIDSAAGTLNINGQSIIVTATTVFGDDIQPAELSTLTPGDMVAVSGAMRQDGTLLATRVHRWPNNALEAVSGVVRSVDDTQKRLQVGEINVSYDGAQLVNVPNGVIRAGDYVRALGADDGSGTGIAASVVQHAVVPAPDPRKDIVLNGAINSVRAADDFDVRGQPVKITSATLLLGLSIDLMSATPWGPASYFLTVFGSLDPSGYVIADLVMAQNGGGTGVTGPVTAIDRAAHTLAIMGLPIQLSSYCYLAGSHGQAIKLDALNVGDQLAVNGSKLGSGWIDCLLAQQGPPSNLAHLNGGHILGSHRPMLGLTGGILADTSNAEFFRGPGLLLGGTPFHGTPITADVFWGYGPFRLADGCFEVDVVGTWTGDHINGTDVYLLQECVPQ